MAKSPAISIGIKEADREKITEGLSHLLADTCDSSIWHDPAISTGTSRVRCSRRSIRCS